MALPTGDAYWTILQPSNADASGFETKVTSPQGYRFLFTSDHLALENAKRALGCVIFALMPEEGLEHALTELKQSFEFYMENRELSSFDPVALLGTGIAVGEDPTD
jgi:hypothetical protein